MAEEAAAPALEEQPVEASAEEVAGQDADAGGEQAAGGDGALKRTREEDEAEQQADERDAKRLASGEEQQEANGVAEAAAAAAAAAAEGEQEAAAATAAAADEDAAAGDEQTANGSGDNPGHGGGDCEPEAAEAAEAGAGDNPGHSDNPGHGEGGNADEGGAGQQQQPQQQQQHAQQSPQRAGPPSLQEGLGTEAHEDGTMSERVAVSKHLVGKLIGKAGATIQQLQVVTQTSIQIDQTDHAEHPDAKVVTLRGAPDCVAMAKVEISKLLDEALNPADGENEERITCPAGIVGCIIGRGGETIRALQQASGSHILVDQNYPEGEDRLIIIKGRGDSTTRAASMIRELILGEPGSATGIIQKYTSGQSLTMQCPRMVVGRVIGRGGEVIKGLQRKYHATIQVEQTGDPTNITISAPPGMLQACEREIYMLINDMGPMGGPYGGPGFRPGFGGGMYGGYGAPMGYGGAPFGAPYGAAYGGAPSPYGGYGAYAMGGAPSPYGGGAMGGAGAYGGAAAGAYGGGGGAMGGAMGGYGAGAAGGGYDAGAAGGGGYAGGAGSGGAAAGGGAGGASVWQAMQDDQGRTYYYNSQTGVSQWEKPAEMP